MGSFFRRYGDYCTNGQLLDSFVEFTIKDDERGDPTISTDAMAMLNILSYEESTKIIELTKVICRVVKEELAKKELELYDIKLEFGRDAATNDVILIDEISGGNMRVYYKNEYVSPLDLENIFLNN